LNGRIYSFRRSIDPLESRAPAPGSEGSATLDRMLANACSRHRDKAEIDAALQELRVGWNRR